VHHAVVVQEEPLGLEQEGGLRAVEVNVEVEVDVAMKRV
jgi:hypothetical protein